MDSSAWIAVIAAFVALASLPFTVQAARAAAGQAAESRRQTALQGQIHIDSQQPYVWLDIMGDDAQGTLLKLTVRNEGPTVATNIKASFDPHLQTMHQPEHFSDLQDLLASGLSYLAPGRKIEWTFDVGHQFFSSDMPKSTTVTINYAGPHGPCPTNTYLMRLDDIQISADVPAGSLHRVAERIKELTAVVKASS